MPVRKKQLIKPAMLGCVLLLLSAAGVGADNPKPISAAAAVATLDSARFTADGKLVKPQDLEQWVFVGTSLGMGYNEAQFNPASPGLFQVVQMEPRAYRYFMDNGHLAPGSMLLLSFYGTDQRVSNNKTGYVQTGLKGREIHLIDPAKQPDGRVFYSFGLKDEGTPVAPGNECVRCHTTHGAFEGTFMQFYPVLSGRVPKAALDKALQDKDIR